MAGLANALAKLAASLTLVATLAAAGSAPGPEAVAGRWAAAWTAKNAAATLALYAPDAVFVHPSGELVTGHDAIAALFAKVLAANDPRIAMSSLCLAQAGDEAWDSGSFRETITPSGGGAPVNLTGHYLLLLHKAAGGAWLIERQIWSGT